MNLKLKKKKRPYIIALEQYKTGLVWCVSIDTMNLELTGDSCAIPTHAWASLGGSLPFPGSSLVVGSAAGLCNPDLVRADDKQTWGTDATRS